MAESDLKFVEEAFRRGGTEKGGMDIKERQAIRERVEKATAGKWEQDERYVVAEVPGGRPGGEVIIQAQNTVTFLKGYPTAEKVTNANFIAHGRQDIPDLLDAFEEAIGLLDESDRYAESLQYCDSPFAVRVGAFLTEHGARDE